MHSHRCSGGGGVISTVVHYRASIGQHPTRLTGLFHTCLHVDTVPPIIVMSNIMNARPQRLRACVRACGANVRA